MFDTRNSEPEDAAVFVHAAALIFALCYALHTIDVFLVRFNQTFSGNVVTHHTKVFSR